MSFFHYNIAKAIFAIILKGTEYGRSEKSTVLRRILRLLYIAIKVYIKVSKYLDKTASVARCFIQKAREGFLIKKSNIFSNDFVIKNPTTTSQNTRKDRASVKNYAKYTK